MNRFASLRVAALDIADAFAEFRDRSFGSWLALAAISIVVVIVVVVAIGPSIIAKPWDVFTLLAGGWRIANGQIPHFDFNNPIGSLTYLWIAIGMKIVGASLGAYVFGNSIFAALISSWAIFVFFRKLPPPIAFLMTVFIVVLLVATRPLGYPPDSNTYAMIYNRYGWALTSLLFIQLFVADRSAGPHAATFDAFSSGMLLGLIFFDKVNFFVCGLAAVPLALILRPELRNRFVSTVVAYAFVCFGFWLAAGVNLLDYARDILSAAHAQSLSARIALFKDGIRANFFQGLSIGGIWLVVVALPAMLGSATRTYAIRTTIILIFIVGSALAITAGNAPELNDVPLFLVAGVILLDASYRRWSPSEQSARSCKSLAELGSLLIAVTMLFGGIFAKDVLSISNSVAWTGYRLSRGPASQQFEAKALQDFVIPHTSYTATAYSQARDTPSRINEGLAVLRRHATRESKVVVLALTDPFSYAMGLTPPVGIPLWWDLNISFDRANYPRPQQLFSEADYVIYPLQRPDNGGCCWETVAMLIELYNAYLQQNYVEVERSSNWVLLARRVQEN